jgi:23S rRNA (uracil-5-)-methyltransferase RumA
MSLRVTIEDRNPDGRGRGQAGERIALVSQAHPGEEVVVRPDRTTRNTIQGRVGKILQGDPRRIEHPCQHEHACTGCPLLAAHPDDEAAFKRGRVLMALQEAGLSAAAAEKVLAPLEPPAELFGYRHYAKQIFTLRRRKVVLGSYVAGTHRVVDNTGCPVLVAPLAALLEDIGRRATRLHLPVHQEARSRREETRPGLRYAIARHSAASGKQLVLLVTSLAESRQDPGLKEDLLRLVKEIARRRGVAGVVLRLNTGTGNALLAGETLLEVGERWLEEELAGFRHRISTDAFFQINPPAAQRLVRRAVEMAGEGDLCLEAFAGVGALTLPLARHFRKVRAVESQEGAVGALRYAARRGGLAGKVEAEAGEAEEVLPRWLAGPTPDAIVLDPPRRGLGPVLTAALETLAQRLGQRRPRLVLLSCDPGTLAKDLPPLLAAGYAVRGVTPVDQFPRTGHVETVTLLR